MNPEPTDRSVQPLDAGGHLRPGAERHLRPGAERHLPPVGADGTHRWAPSGTRYSVLMNTFLTSVKAANASGPNSRPSPDCPNPPNGVE